MRRELWFRRRSLPLPTWRTCAVLGLLVLVLASTVILRVHDWLCLNQPLPAAKYLIVEGWAPDPVPWAAVQWAKAHDIERIYVTGVPLERARFGNTKLSYADITAETLVRMGADPAKVIKAPATTVATERTRAMARALRTVLDTQPPGVGEREILLFSHGTHARRSHMHFQQALGSAWQVGVISVPNEGYPANRWWRYSEGVKAVLDELVGLLVQSLGGE